MPKQINVKLGFEADTSQAKKQIQDLQNSLNNLIKTSSKDTGLGFSKEIAEAQQSIVKLQTALNHSLNADTSRLDLSKLNNQLAQSGLSVESLGRDFQKLGPAGEAAFLNLTQSIVTAQKPMIETNRLLDGMWTALKNTARWQLSSSILHGFMSSLQTAYGYAQDLDKSLNSIRIVSGQTVEQMAAFAEQANRSAQALSTSTLAYTDAALIFYQQGLSGDAVNERVDTVLKLSNVTGDSAEQVSSYMTAIWNNFYDGSQSLESFADKITALGAATASSSAEIAAGLQQFAAIGNTVGLSYDYAATALATIVAQTRQSESSVGNGLRTVFARLSSLKQGGTDEDGTDLTKYTKALAEYGVNVKDQNGELKEMDQILDEIGAKWQTLSKDQKVALAQTVGGVRQYATIMALFENWDDFQKNLRVTQGAEGTLQEQADIYAESWEAARKRVQTAWQAIYQDLIDEQFFINVLNVIEKVLKGVDTLIDSMGGLKGVLGGIGTAIIVLFRDRIEGALTSIGKTISVISGRAQVEANKLSQQFFTEAKKLLPSAGDANLIDASADEARLKVQQLELSLAKDLKDVYASLPAISQENLNRHIQTVQQLGEEVVLAKQLQEQAIATRDNAFFNLRDLNSGIADKLRDKGRKYYEDLGRDPNFRMSAEYQALVDEGADNQTKAAIRQYIDAMVQEALAGQKTGQAVGALDEYKNATFQNAIDKESRYADYLQNNKNGSRYGFEVQEFNDLLKNSGYKEGSSYSASREFDDAYANLLKTGPTEEALSRWEKAKKNLQDYIPVEDEAVKKQEELIKSMEGQEISHSITQITSGLSMAVMGFNALKSAADAAMNPDLSTWEKFSRVTTSVVMGLPALVSGLSSVASGFATLNKVAQVHNTTLLGLIAPYAGWALAIGVAVGLIYALYRALTIEEHALKKSNESLKEAKQAADEANQSYQNLKSTLESYDNLKKNLSDMDEADAKQAVSEMNAELLDLITNTEGWQEAFKNGIEYDDNGLIKIDNAQARWLKNAQALELSAANRLEYEEKIANIGAQQKVNDKNYTGPKIYGSGWGTEQVLDDFGNVVAEYAGRNNISGQVADVLAQNQLNGKLNFLNAGYTGSDKELAQLKEVLGNAFPDEDIDSLVNQVDAILRDSEQRDAYLELISQHTSDLLQTDAFKQAAAREAVGLSSEFGNLTEESQSDVIDLLKNADAEQLEKLSNILAADTDYPLIDALKEAGIAIDDLNFKIDEEKLSHHLPLNINADDLRAFSGSTEDLQKDVDDLSDYLSRNVDLIDELDHSLVDCKEGVDEIAYAIIRFDDAIQDVSENYEEWMDGLNSKAWQDVQKACNELKKTYGNLLDIDGSQLSEDFLRNTENLELMNQAIQGNIDSYDELVDRAGVDWLKVNLHLSDTAANDLVNEFNSLIDSIYPNFRDIPAHASLDNADFIAGLEEMLNATNMTVAQAQEWLANMGIDAEVVEDKTRTRDNKEFVGAEVEELAPKTLEGAISNVSGVFEDMGLSGTFSYDVPQFKMAPRKEKHTEEKENTAFALKIKTAKKAVGGNIKYNNSSHGGGANGAGNTRGSGGKGGGGGSQKKKTVKEHKKPEQKTDRYHDIKERIADLNTELKRLEKTENRVYGKAKLKYMDQEIEKLEKQIELTDEYIDEIKKYAAADQARLRGIGMGATFDDTGRLNNYEQVLANIVASYNSAVATYNGAVDQFNASAQEDADNARLEAADKALAAAKETYDERLKILDQYEDTFNLLQEKWDERIDQVWQLFDKKLEQITWRIEFELDWNEKELTQFDWLLKYIGKDADHAADAIANLAKQMGVYEESVNWAKEGISEIFGLHGISFDFDNADPQQLYDQLAQFMQMQNLESQLTETEANALLKYMEAMRDAYDGMYDSWIEAHDKMMNAFDEWNDRLQEGLNDITQYGKELEGIQKIVELTGRKMLKMTTQDMNRMSQAIVTNAQEYLRAATARRDALEPEVLAAEAHLQELIAGGASEEAINLARDEYRHMMEAWNEATNDWYSAFADALQAGQDAFETFIEQSTQDYKEGFGSMDLDYMQEQFERQKKVRDLYLDDYQKYHELNNTAKELNKSLASTNNELIRTKMLDLQDEMNAAMQNGVQISEAQAEIYARRVALLQAEAELLDAQNAKSAVRMTRDNEGNFSYTYTADQEQIGEAQNNYGDKFYELLQYERDYADQIQSEMLDSFQEFIDRRNEIAETYKDDQDAYVQAMEDLNEEYLAYVDYYVGELDMDFYEMGRLRDDDWLDFENITGLKLAEHDDFISHFTDTILGDLTNDYNTAGELATQWQHLMEESCQAATTAVNTYQSNTETTYNKAGENIETYGLKINTKFDEIANKSANTADAVEDMGQNMVNTMAAIQSEAYQLDNTWAYVMDSMRNQIANTINALYSLMQKLDETTAHAQATIAAVQAAAMASAAMGYPTDYGGSYDGSDGSGGSSTTNDSNPGTTSTSGTHNFVVKMPPKDDLTDKIKRSFGMGNMNIQRLATGGYTGAWGDEGRLALLHEKELVLNKEDTANMLTAVNVVRSMMDSIAGNGMMNLLALAAGGVSGSFGNMLDQNVHIEANFPNVQSHTEIEMAINNLINSASQYVNRKS